MRTRRRPLAVLTAAVLLLTACSTELAGTARPVPITGSTSAAPSDPAESTAGTPDSTDDPAVGGGPIEGPVPRPTPGGSGAGVIPAGLSEFYDQQLDWQSCVPFNTNGDLAEYFSADGLECANLIVPLDYTVPTGPTVSVAVIRAPATGSDPVGSLQTNPGGPGGSGLEYVASISADPAWATLRESFDLIGFDTRGLNASRPRITCQTDAEKDADRASNLRTTTPAGIDAIVAANTLRVQQCIERTGQEAGIDGAAFLVTMGSVVTVKDMDVLRAVLGDDKLSYLGYSYGTLLGSLYADQFGANVRAMVLDGAVDPDADQDQSDLDQAAAFQGTFQAFATWCAAQQSCPLGADPAQATAAFQKVTRALLDTPLPLPDGRVLTYSDAVTGTVQSLYSEEYWQYLRTGLQNLINGDGYLMMALADSYLGRNSDGEYSGIFDVFTGVTCMDQPRRDPADTDVTQDRKLAEAAPFEDSGDPIVPLPSRCDGWPGQTSMDTDITPAPGTPTLVVVSTTGDPATPFADGQALAEELDASLIVAEGDRHTSYLSAGSSCVDDAGTDYLVDLKQPAAGLTCQ